jgi:hypothetical protein
MVTMMTVVVMVMMKRKLFGMKQSRNIVRSWQFPTESEQNQGRETLGRD